MNIDAKREMHEMVDTRFNRIYEDAIAKLRASAKIHPELAELEDGLLELLMEYNEPLRIRAHADIDVMHSDHDDEPTVH